MINENNKKFLIFWNNCFPSIKNLNVLSKIVNIADKVSIKCVLFYNPHNTPFPFYRFKQLIETLFLNIEVCGYNDKHKYINDSTVTDIFITEDELNRTEELSTSNKDIHIMSLDVNEPVEDNINTETDTNITPQEKEKIINIQKLSIEEQNEYNNLVNALKNFLHLKENVFNIVPKEKLETYLEDIIIRNIFKTEIKNIDTYRIEKFVELLNDIKNNKIVIEQLFSPDTIILKDLTNINYSDRLDLTEIEKVFNDTRVLNILKTVIEKEEDHINFGVIFNTENPLIKYSNTENYIYVSSASTDKLKSYAEKSLDKLEVKVLHNDEIKIYRFITPATIYSYTNYHCIDDILKHIDFFINTNFDFNTVTPDIIKKYIEDYYSRFCLNYEENKSNITKFDTNIINYYLKNMFYKVTNDMDNLPVIPIRILLDHLLYTDFEDYNERLLKIVLLDFIYDNWEEMKSDYLKRLKREIFDSDYSIGLEYKGLNNEQYACIIRSTNNLENELYLYSNSYVKYKDVKDKYIKDIKDVLDSYYFSVSTVLKIEELRDVENLFEVIKNKNFKEDKEYDVSKLNIGFVYKKIVEEALLAAKTINNIGKNIYDEKIPSYLQNEIAKIYNITENIFIELVYELENMILKYKTECSEDDIRMFVSEVVSNIIGFLYVKKNEMV